jgi:DnaK suppressor protein
MPPLAPDLAAELGKLLRQQRADLWAQVSARTGKPDGDRPAIGPGTHGEPGEHEPEAEMISDDEVGLVMHDAAMLREIDNALERLGAGEAGVCTDCGAEIPAERLLASPTAHTCVECQRRIELRARTEHLPGV